MDKSRKLAGYGLAARASFTPPDFPRPKLGFHAKTHSINEQLIQLDVNALSISISADEVKQIEAIAEPVRQSAKELYPNTDRRKITRIGLDGGQGKVWQLSSRFGRRREQCGLKLNDAGELS
jgi:hypothetical protein